MPDVPHPPIADRAAWRTLRSDLLTREKALTRQKDALAAERRRLPMVPLDKEYALDGPDGKVRLIDLFDGKRQLIVYHFMFGPDWERGCPGCTSYVDELSDLSLLAERETAFLLVSRAPLAKLDAYKAERGWSVPWYSSFGTDFNVDFDATRGEDEVSAISVFFQLDGVVYHTYSSFARGVETLTNTYSLLDITPYGRQEDWEDSPEGWPQRPTYG